MSEEQNKNVDAAETNSAEQAESQAPDTGAETTVAGGNGSGNGGANGAGDRVAQLEAEVAALKDQMLRAMAEAENTRRRAARDREDASKYAVAGFAKDMLDVADNLRRALEAVPADTAATDEVMKSLSTGVEATERQLLAALERAGIKKLDPLDETFDPNFHQVMFEVENTGKPAGTVVQVIQAGYTIHGRLLREALVGVAKGSRSRRPWMV